MKKIEQLKKLERSIELLTWGEISDKIDKGIEIDPIERFIYDNEPCGVEMFNKFREGLRKALEYI